jgi:hypothetical protein
MYSAWGFLFFKKGREMPKIQYEEKRFSLDTRLVISQADEIINQYQAQGFRLTLRQLYYQFVSRALIPNTEKSYKRLGNIISDARRNGDLDWDAIEDRTRHLRKLSHWNKPQSILESARQSYHLDLWENQGTRVEVWVEKDALVGVIEDVCERNDVPYFACRGYVSDSEMWNAAQRHIAYNQNVIVLHLGDHDPSGIDMTRDIKDRLELFNEGINLEVRRIALTMRQIEELRPPPNPAKITDSRFQGYSDKYGNESWELDALEPRYISNLIENEILGIRDDDSYMELKDRQEKERAQIQEVINKWNTLF